MSHRCGYSINGITALRFVVRNTDTITRAILAVTISQIYLYESPNGRVPKKLAYYFFDLDNLVRNLPADLKEKKRSLTKKETSKLRTRLKILAREGAEPLRHTKWLVKRDEERAIFLLKVVNKTHNPRFYFTAHFESEFVFLNALSKDHWDEDPSDLEQAQERFEELVESRNDSRPGEEDD